MTITMYIHHEIHDADAMQEGGADIDTQLTSLGHDFSETWYGDASMQHALLVAEFGSSADVVTHFRAISDSGLDDALGTVFTITHADVVGDVDDEARAVLGQWDFFHFLAPAPMG